MAEPRPAWPLLTIDAAWKTATVTALTTGTAPAGGWPDNWVVADTKAVRQPEGNLSAAQPQAVTFDLTLPAATPRRAFLLLAVCSSATAAVTPARLAGATLADLALQSAHVAAHAAVLG
jgi:hypothetical protein